LPVWELIETKDDEIAIEQGKIFVATHANKHVEDIDPFWFLLVFLDCFPNGQGLVENKVSVKRWLSYLIQIDGSPFQSHAFVCVAGDWIIMRHRDTLNSIHLNIISFKVLYVTTIFLYYITPIFINMSTSKNDKNKMPNGPLIIPKHFFSFF